MVNISTYLDPNLIVVDLKASNKEEAIRVLVDRLFKETGAKELYGFDRAKVFEEVMSREGLHSTGIGNGLAFPHARLDGWGKMVIVMGVSSQGLDFASVDGEPVRGICLMLSSASEPYAILQAMAALARFFNNTENVLEILHRPISPKKIYERFNQAGVLATKIILARDIARPVSAFLKPDISIEEATRLMHLRRLDVIPVVDDKGKFCGQISCLDIFKYGMPDFFNQLHTISFVRHIDPFQKYFRIRGDLKVKDFMITDAPSISEEATLLEIIFQMTVKRRFKLFVVHADGSLAGEIDRFCVIDKILFF